MASLTESIVSRTTANATIASLVGTRVRPDAALQGDTYPLVIFQVASNQRGHRLANNTGSSNGIADATVDFAAMAYNRSQVESIVQALEFVWDGYAGTVAGVQILRSAQIDDDSMVEGTEPGTTARIYTRTVTYRFKYRVTPPTF